MYVTEVVPPSMIREAQWPKFMLTHLEHQALSIVETGEQVSLLDKATPSSGSGLGPTKHKDVLPVANTFSGYEYATSAANSQPSLGAGGIAGAMI